MPIRTNSEGLLEILHPETGAYVPASTLLQVEGGLLAALVPDQMALLSDIRNSSSYLQSIENTLSDVRSELIDTSTKVSQSNNLLALLTQVDAALATVNQAINSLESLQEATTVLLGAIKNETIQLSAKLPLALGAKLKAESLSVALASDSSIFASLSSLLLALSDGGIDSVYSVLTGLSGKIPATLGAKIRDASLSVALATDSTIFTSLSNILSALTGTVNNTVYGTLTALSAKLPTSLGAKSRVESLSVALATDSTIFTSLTNILNALSGGGAESVLSYLSTVAGAQHWEVPTKLNETSPVINGGNGATSSSAYILNPQLEALSLQNYYSFSGISAQFVIELRITANSTALHDRTFYYRGDIASPYSASTGAYPGESPILIPTYGYVQAVVHLSSISGGNVTTYAREIK